MSYTIEQLTNLQRVRESFSEDDICRMVRNFLKADATRKEYNKVYRKKMWADAKAYRELRNDGKSFVGGTRVEM